MRSLLLAFTALTPIAAHAATCTAPPAAAAAAGYTVQTFGQDGITLGKNIFIDHGQTGISQQGQNILITGQGNNNAYNDQISSAPSEQQGSFFGSGGYFEITFSFTGTPSNQGGWPSFWGNTLWNATMDNPNIEIDNVEWWDTANLQFGTGMWAWGPSGAITSTSGNQPTQLGSGFNPALPHKYALLWTEAQLRFFIDDKPGPNVNSLTGAYAILNLQQYHLIAGTGPRNPMTIYSIKVWQKNQGSNSFVGVSVPTPCAPGASTSDGVATTSQMIGTSATGPDTSAASTPAGTVAASNPCPMAATAVSGPTGDGSFQALPTGADTSTLLSIMAQNADHARPESGGTLPITLAPGDLTPGTGGSVTDAQGNVYTLPWKGGAWGQSMGQPTQNGSPINDGTGWVDAIRIVNGIACFENAKGLGWGCKGSGTWVADPGSATGGAAPVASACGSLQNTTPYAQPFSVAGTPTQVGATPDPATPDTATLQQQIATLQAEVAQLEQQAAAIDPTAIATSHTANTTAAGQQRIQGSHRGDAWLKQQNGSSGDQ